MSSIPSNHFTLIEAFLGAEAVPLGERGPEVLLGLDAGEQTPARVYQALQERMALLAQHPRGSSPEADMVRLYLQAAATQLLAPPPPLLLKPAVQPSAPQPAGTPAQAVMPTESAPAAAPPPVLAPSAHPHPFALVPEGDSSGLDGPAPSVAPAPRVAAVAEAGGRHPSAPAVAVVATPPPPPPRPGPVQGPAAAAGPPISPTDPLVREAARLVGAFGGLTPEVVQRLAILAMARGLPATAVSSVLASLNGQGGGGPETAPPAGRPQAAPVAHRPQERAPTPAQSTLPTITPPPRPERGTMFAPVAPTTPAPRIASGEEEDPGQRLLKVAVLVGASVFFGALVLMLVGILLISNTGAPPPTPEPEPAATPIAAKPTPKPAPVDEALPGDIPDAAGVVRLIAKAAEPSAKREDTVGRVERAIPVLAAWWPRLDAGQRASTISTLVDLTVRLGSDLPLSERLISAIAAQGEALGDEGKPFGVDRVFPSAWSVGALGRISSERDLPAAIRLRVQSAIAASLTGARLPANASFANGALLALRSMPLRIISGPGVEPAGALAAMEKWEQATRSLFAGGAGESVAAENAVLDGLEQILMAGPEADRSKAVFEVVTSICARLRWRAGDPGRRRLIQWFDDPRVSDADLAVITAAIVSKSSAEGVDLSMVLTQGATPEQRTNLRDAYQGAWGLGSSPGGGGGGSWAQIARDELTAPETPETLAALRAAIIYARISEAAYRRQRGDTDGMSEVLRRFVAPIRRGQTPILASANVGGGSGADGEWALRYLSTDKNLPPKLARLQEIERQAPEIGPIDADVLAEVGLLAGGELKAAAQRIMPRFSDSAALNNAVLKFLPRAGRSTALSRLIVALTGRPMGPLTGEAWQAAARRALVERVLELIAGDAATKEIDAAAAALAEVYAVMAGRQPSEGGVPEDEGGKLARDGAAELFAQLRDAAIRVGAGDKGPITLDEIDRRHGARLSVARGLVQQFIADQQACVELMACIVASERPGRAEEVGKVLSGLREQSREARHVLVQLKVGEEAMLRLWLIRAGEAQP